MKRRKTLFIIVSIIAVLVLSVFAIKNHVKTQVKDLFKLNKTLQEEGYNMADFEFRMLSVIYNLDNGNISKGLTILSDYHAKLTNKEGLIKVPKFSNNQEEIDFYLSLQNPETGAFIDSDAPYFIYWPVTENVLNHIEELQDSTTLPLKLKYPLQFLDSISNPQNLVSFLNDKAYVGWLAPKFPMTSFFFVRELFSCANEDNVLTRNNFYVFSKEWKQTYKQWMYEFQDPETGMWGPRNRKTKQLVVKDLDNTASLVKYYRDKNGNDLDADFPLRYNDELFNSTLESLIEKFPNDDDFTNIHAWNLKIAKGMNLLLRYLWKDLSDENKEKAKSVFAEIIKTQFEKYYVENEGAFSYYPNAEHASCDGITNFSYDKIGAVSYEKQKIYWGEPKKNVLDLGLLTIKNDWNSAISFIDTIHSVNSIRIYHSNPDFQNLTKNVWAVLYPEPSPVLDVMEVVPNIVKWSETSTLSMGNWTSMADIQKRFSEMQIKKPLVFKGIIPIMELDSMLEKSSTLYFVGYDVLQTPIFITEIKP